MQAKAIEPAVQLFFLLVRPEGLLILIKVFLDS